MLLEVAVWALLAQTDLSKKAWERGSIFESAQAAPELARMQVYFQPLRDVPPYRLAGQPVYERSAFPPDVLLGDLLFHAPKLLGPRAGTFGLSCYTCHPGGSTNGSLFVEKASDRPGNVDLLSDYLYPEADDGVFNPRNVPSLRGVAATGPYRHDGAAQTLPQADALVVGHEFQQQVPAPWLAALDAYVASLEWQRDPYLDAAGELTPAASPEARAGEAVFEAPRPAFEGKSCASCHPKAKAFTDRAQHPLRHGDGVGVLGRSARFDTPALLNLAETAPYFFDGTATTLRAAVAQIDRRHALGLSPAEQASLTAYLEAIGAVESPRITWSAKERARQALAWGRLVESTEDERLWTLCLDAMRHQLRQAVWGAAGPVGGLKQLGDALEALARKKPTPATRARLAALRAKPL